MAGYNFLPNTQWQIRTGMLPDLKRVPAGTSNMPEIIISSYTTNTNTPTLYCSNTGFLKPGDLIASHGTPDAALVTCCLEVLTVTTNTSFTVKCPLGLKTGGTSYACGAWVVSSTSTGATNGNGPDSWSISSGLDCWIDDNAANNKPGSTYQVGIRNNTATPQQFYHMVPAGDLELYKGKTICFGVNALQKTGTGYFKVFIQTTAGMTYSSNFASAGNYAYAELSITIPTTTTFICMGIEVCGAVNDVSYVSQPKAVVGTACGDYSFDNRDFFSICKISPIPYITRTFNITTVSDGAGTYGHEINFFQETHGAIAKTVRGIFTQLEARSNTGDQALAIRNQQAIPQTYALTMYTPAANVMATCTGLLALKNGTAFIYSPVPGSYWYTCSIDVNHFVL